MFNFILEDVDKENLEVLRLIRNSCREFMTRNNKEISPEDQIAWFNKIDIMVQPFIFKLDGLPIGYGLLKIENNYALLSGGLIEDFRNKGYGKILFNMLIDKTLNIGLVPKLEVLKTNIRAVKTYRALGFETVHDNDILYTMILNGK